MSDASPALGADTAEVDWMEILRQRVAVLGSIAKVADEIGYSRSAVSLALAGKYPGGTKKISAAIIAFLVGCDCPFLQQCITAAACRAFRSRPMPLSAPDALRHWTACQGCAVGARLRDAEEVNSRRMGGVKL